MWGRATNGSHADLTDVCRAIANESSYKGESILYNFNLIGFYYGAVVRGPSVASYVAKYLLSWTAVPIQSAWLHKHTHTHHAYLYLHVAVFGKTAAN